MSRASRLELLRELKERLQQIERPRPGDRALLSTGVAALDGLLPRHGLEWGTLTEWLSAGEGHGAMALTLAIAAGVLQDMDLLVVIDGRREFYPPAAAGLGICLERLVLVRPANDRDVLWAWEQALRCGGVAIVMGWLDTLNDRAFRKLQLAAETGGSLAFLLRPASCRMDPSWAEARFLVAGSCLSLIPNPSPGARGKRLINHHAPSPALRAQRLHVELLYARGGARGGSIELELSDETDEARAVSVVSRLANPAAAPRPARA